MDKTLRAILLRDNPWLSQPGIVDDWLEAHLPEQLVPRTAVASERARWLRADRAHIVVGPRQAGKSTAIWAHFAETRQPALFVDCEQPLVQEWCRSAPLFLADLEAEINRPVPLFFDETQHLENAGLFIKGLIDRKIGVPVMVTGSSSFHLGARVRESLAGRATRSRLLPFSLAEVTNDLSHLPEIARAEKLNQRLQRHLRFGGYPEIWLSNEPSVLLTELVQAIILRDASVLHRIGRPQAFRRLLQLAAAQAGSLVNLAEWASLLGISRDTVASYLEILESAHVLCVVRPFAGGKRSELTRSAKIYFVDTGIRNQLVNSYKALEERIDSGATLEGWVFSELWKALPPTAGLNYWRSKSKAEIDFVLSLGTTVIAVEVKAGALRRATLSRSARSFIDAYRPKVLYVVNTGAEISKRIGETAVRFISPGSATEAIAALQA